MSVNIPYINNDSISKTWKVTREAPLDIRMVMSSKSDLIDVTKFGGSDEESDYRYIGMIVSVVNDAVESNNGIYVLRDNDFNYDDSDYALWEKIGDITWPEGPASATGEDYYLDWNDGNPQWKKVVTPTVPQSLSDLDDVNVTGASNGQVLKYNNGQWVAADEAHGSGSGSEVSYTATVTASTPNAYEIGKLTIDGVDTTIYGKDTAGSGSGVTEQDIDYRLVFTPTGEGGLGYTERGANGTGLGYLTKAHFASNGTQGIIPAGTSYEDIFRAVLEGEEQLDVNVTSKSVTYNASNQYFPIGNVTAQPSDASIQYSSSSTGPWTTYNNDIHGTNAGTYSGYFRVSKGGKVSSTKQANLVINKKSVTVTPDLVSTTKYVGETVSFTSSSPIVSGAIGNDTNLIKSTINSYSGTKYTVSDSQPLNTVGTTSVLMTSQLINTLSNDYSNYSFSSGTKNVTVKPRIQYMTYLDINTWKDHITSTTTYYSAPYDTLIGSVYPGIQSVDSGYYMLPFIHDTANGAFKLRIGAPYQLNPSDMKYWDTQNNIWKAKTSEQFNGFGNPRQYEENGITWNEYTYSGNTATSPLAISIQKQ